MYKTMIIRVYVGGCSQKPAAEEAIGRHHITVSFHRKYTQGTRVNQLGNCPRFLVVVVATVVVA